MSAIRITETGRPPIAHRWHRGLIRAMVDAQVWKWLSKPVVAGALLVGATPIHGAFTGFVGFFGVHK